MRSNRWTTFLQNPVVAIVLMLLVAVPALFAAPNMQRIDQLLVYGLFGVLLLAVALFRGQGRPSLAKLRTLALSGPNLPVLLYLGWCGVCAAFSSERLLSEIAMVQLAVGVVLYGMVVYQFREKNQVLSLLTGVIVVGVLLVLGAFAWDYNRHLTTLAGPLHDRQLFGAVIALLLPVTMGVAAGTKNRGWKLAAQIAAVLLVAALLLSGCRSSWTGAAVAVFAFTLMSVVFIWKAEGLGRIKHQLVIAPLLAVIALGVFFSLNRQIGRAVQARVQTLNSVATDESVMDREHLWQVALQMVRARPATGWGPNAYPVAQAAFNPDSRPEALIRRMGPTLFESPHNTYLQIAAETGVPGLLLYLGILVTFFVYGLRAVTRMDRGLRQYVLIGCLAAIAGQAVDAVANPGYVFPEVSTFFWLVLGIGMCAAGLGQTAREEVTETASSEAPLGLPAFLYRGLRTATAGCCVLILGAAVLSIQGGATAAFARLHGISTPTYCDIITDLALLPIPPGGPEPPAPAGLVADAVLGGGNGALAGSSTITLGESQCFRVFAVSRFPDSPNSPETENQPFEFFQDFIDVGDQRAALRIKTLPDPAPVGNNPLAATFRGHLPGLSVSSHVTGHHVIYCFTPTPQTVRGLRGDLDPVNPDQAGGIIEFIYQCGKGHNFPVHWELIVNAPTNTDILNHPITSELPITAPDPRPFNAGG